MPTVATVNSSMSATELTRALTGDLASVADKLATLDATSIRIPKRPLSSWSLFEWTQMVVV